MNSFLSDASVFQAILSTMGEGIIFVDADDRLAFINAAAEEIRGIDAAKFVGKKVTSIHAPDSAPRIRSLVEGLRSGEIQQSKRVLDVKGRCFENSYYPIRDGEGGFLGTLLISRDITETQRLKEENLTLRQQVRSSKGVGELHGRSPAIRRVFEMIETTAGLDSTILVTGESGTGKELVARAVHDLGSRKSRPLVRVNCAALPETLLESELFGHEKGAFTGAIRERKGKFEQAHTGTIFLDEIGEMPLQAQAKLLRVLQEKTVERIGGSREIRVDVRIIAATNRDLRREVEAGRFRGDLFYRLNVIPIHLPPLRERREDILFLAQGFLEKFSARMGKSFAGFSKDAAHLLLAHPYPGNVRELENAVERAVALGRGGCIEAGDLPTDLAGSPSLVPPCVGRTLADATVELEKRLIREALVRAGNRKGEAARLLNISRKNLWEKMKSLGMD